MPVDSKTYYLDLYNLLKTRGYRPVPLDASGQGERTGKKDFAPQEAEVIRFDFIKNGENYGEVWATIENENTLVLYYDDKIMDSPDDNTSGTEFTDSFPGLLRHLKSWAQRRGLMWDTRNRDHLASDMQQRRYVKKESISESYQIVNRKTSSNDAIPKVKIIIEHTRNLEETEKRYHNISRIFIENTQGERFLINTKRPGIAKVYARHIAEGGTPYDERGKHIASLVEELNKMAGFVRATKNKQFNESALALVNEGLAHYNNLRETLSKMIGRRGYNTYFENWTPVLIEETTEENQLNELFVKETLDPRIESVLPILSKIHKQGKKIKEVAELEEWADGVITNKLGANPIKEEAPDSQFAETISDIVSSPYMAENAPDTMNEAETTYYHLVVDGVSKGKFKDIKKANQLASMMKKEFPSKKINIEKHEEFAEDLNADQKRVGQLGPTEKAKKISPVLGKPPKQHPFKGKLVGASESKQHKRS